ncbi:MAG: 3-oxoacyl-ACP reductase FabG [Pseudomonadota bacterium]|nr:3-oxoacyl-ACP reductase FabG [Pseudomonadota bacterium]
MEKLAFITGASRGIGLSIAEQFIKAGYQVVGSATSQEGADRLQAHFDQLGEGHLGVCMNQAESDSIQAAVDAIKAQYDKLPDVLVNNAGITRDGLMMRMKASDWNDVINTNLTGVFTLTQLCVKAMMKARFGRVIQIGSVVGRMGNPGQANYCAAKAGIEGFSRSLAKEVASRGITVNTIAPGFIQTDMTAKLSEDQQKAMLAQVPAGRMGHPEDIAHAALFLAGEQAAYINGATLPVNGGLYLF